MMGLEPATAYRLAVEAEAPDSEVKSPWDMEEKYTYVDFSKQPLYHALSGKTHGVELAITTYALLRGFPEKENEKFLLHRFGDCFGHVKTKYDDKDIDPIDLNLYVEAVEDALDNLLKNVQQRFVGEKIIIPWNDDKNKEIIMKENFIVVDYYNSTIHTTVPQQSLKLYFIKQLFSRNNDIPSEIFYLVNKLQKDIQTKLPKNINQNKWEMYPLITGHMLEGEAVDAINRRKNMFYYYVESLCYIIEKKHNGTNGKSALNKVKEIVEFGEKTDTIRYDAILAFEIAKVLKPNQNEYSIGIPVKYNPERTLNLLEGLADSKNKFEEDANRQLGWLNKYLENHNYYVYGSSNSNNAIFINIKKRKE